MTDCASVAVPIASELAIQHYYVQNLLWTIGLALSFVIPFLFLSTRFSAKLSEFTSKLGWFFSIVLYLIVFIIIYQIVMLPLEFYSDYVIEHKYGLSNQSWMLWLENYGKWSLLFMIGAVAFVWIFYLILEKSPKRWWIYCSIAAVLIQFFITFISPIWIDPLFNKIVPMRDGTLKQELQALARKAGMQNDEIYEINKSQDTTTTNAYVTGLFGSERIVIWDTSLTTDQIDGLKFTMGHEIGHYVLKHNWWQMVYFSIATFVIFYLTHISARFILRRYRNQLGFNHLSNIASFPLFLVLINFFLLLSSPLFNVISRNMERDADRFGLNLTHNNEAAAKLFANFAKNDLANPDPGCMYTFWRASHPSLKERIEFCNHYCPWKE